MGRRYLHRACGATARLRLQTGGARQEYAPKHAPRGYEAEFEWLRQLAHQMGELAGCQIEAASAALAAYTVRGGNIPTLRPKADDTTEAHGNSSGWVACPKDRQAFLQARWIAAAEAVVGIVDCWSCHGHGCCCSPGSCWAWPGARSASPWSEPGRRGGCGSLRRCR